MAKAAKTSLGKERHKFNALRSTLVTSVQGLIQSCPGVESELPPEFIGLPDEITVDNLKDSQWVVPDVRMSKVLRLVVLVVKAARAWRSHYDEAGVFGKGRVQALHALLQRSIDALTGRLDAIGRICGKPPDSNVSVAALRACCGPLSLLRRHFPHAMVVPAEYLEDLCRDREEVCMSMSLQLMVIGCRRYLVPELVRLSSIREETRKLLAESWPGRT